MHQVSDVPFSADSFTDLKPVEGADNWSDVVFITEDLNLTVSLISYRLVNKVVHRLIRLKINP